MKEKSHTDTRRGKTDIRENASIEAMFKLYK